MAPTIREYYNTGDDQIYQFYGDTWLAQTFTVGATLHTITSVKLKFRKWGTVSTLTVSIRATTGGHPSGNDLTSGTINAGTFSSTPTWYTINLTEYTLAANTMYAIVCRVGGDADNLVGWSYDATSPTYTGGNFEYSTNAGANWGANTNNDFMFEVWGNPVAVNYTVAVSEILGMADSVPTKASYKRSVADVLGMVESVGKVKGMVLTVSDLLCMVDAVDKVKGLRQTAVDILGLTDSVASKAGYKQAISDSLGMLEIAPTKAYFKQAVSDKLGILDSAQTKAGYRQAISDSLGMIDAVGTKASFKKAISEVLGMIDSASRGFPLKVIISEILGLRDRVEARKHLSKIGDLPDHTITGGA